MKLLHAFFTLTALAGCGGNKCPEPFFDGKGSDEAWRTMQDAEARAKGDDAKAVTLFFPVDAQKISTAMTPKFHWSTPLTASAAPRPDRTRSTFSRLSAQLYGSAWAHLPPVTGPVHLLRITAPGRSCPIEVLTTLREWTPSTAAWSQLQETMGQTLTFDVFSAYLQENRISEGPFHFMTPKTFSVAP